MAMKRLEFLKALAKVRQDEIVITCWQSIDAWEKCSPSKYNFQSARTMGDCSSFGLGLALARPDKKIIVLEGDGSLCMASFSLITIAENAPVNLFQFVMHNKVYETTGGQTIPNADNIDLAMIARGSGISKVYRYGDIGLIEKELPFLLQETGPVFIVVDIIPDESHFPGSNFKDIRAFDRECDVRFKAALKE